MPDGGLQPSGVSEGRYRMYDLSALDPGGLDLDPTVSAREGCVR
jgi:hypothetical protein